MAKRGHDARHRIRESSRNVHFASQFRCVRQLLDGRSEARGHAGLVATRIDPVPAVALQVDRNQSMKEEARPCAVEGQSLITQCSGNPAGPQQCDEQMALRVTEPRSMLQDVRGRARDDWKLMIRTVSHQIPHPLEASVSDIFVVFGITDNVRSCSDNRRIGAIDDVRRFENSSIGFSSSAWVTA